MYSIIFSFSRDVLLFVLTSITISLITMFISIIISNLHGAPYVPIRRKLVKDLLKFGNLSKDNYFYDLGSGDGRVMFSALTDFNVKKAVGYEISPWPYWESKFLFWQKKLDKTTQIYRRNFFEANLSDTTFIYIYLFPKLVNQLAGKIGKECKNGTKVLCPSFPINLDRHPGFKLLKSGEIGKITAYLYEKI